MLLLNIYIERSDAYIYMFFFHIKKKGVIFSWKQQQRYPTKKETTKQGMRVGLHVGEYI